MSTWGSHARDRRRPLDLRLRHLLPAGEKVAPNAGGWRRNRGAPYRFAYARHFFPLGRSERERSAQENTGRSVRSSFKVLQRRSRIRFDARRCSVSKHLNKINKSTPPFSPLRNPRIQCPCPVADTPVSVTGEAGPVPWNFGANARRVSGAARKVVLLRPQKRPGVPGMPRQLGPGHGLPTERRGG